MKIKGAAFCALVLAFTLISCGQAPSGTASVNSEGEAAASEASSAVSYAESGISEENGDSVSEEAGGAAAVPQVVFDETETGMIRPMDAIMLTEYVTKRYYEADDGITYWTIMYYYLSAYGSNASGASYADLEDGKYLVLGSDIIRETGRVIFGETTAMPEIPPDIHRIGLHEDGKYYVKMDPRPESLPVMICGVVNPDGSCDIVAQLTDTNGKTICEESFHLVPKTGINSLLGYEYYYTIYSVGLG
ncbi:MAG: hypothetical protein K6E30_06655 [Lachnospiraceae bacterium]|nr:hypothetical protein [Lachnospiraceae bacterium]